MERQQVIDNIRQVAASVLPKGSRLYLYGSRARGDNHEDSDWGPHPMFYYNVEQDKQLIYES